MMDKPLPPTTPMPTKHENPKAKPMPLKALAAQTAGVLHPDDNVETAGNRMRKHDAETWPVVDDAKLVGIVDEKNPDWKAGGHGHDPKDCQVGEIMNRHAIFCYEDDDCTHAEKLMINHQLSYLPVVDREMRIVGIYSRREISEMSSGNEQRQRIAQRAMEMARGDGRVAFTDDDFAKASAELVETRGDTDVAMTDDSGH